MNSDGMPYWFYKLKESERAKFRIEDINGCITIKLVNQSFFDKAIIFLKHRLLLNGGQKNET